MVNETNGLAHLVRSAPHHFQAKITTKSRNTEVDFFKIRQISPTTHRKGPLVTTVISERRMVSQCSSEGTAAPPEPKAAPRPSSCMVSSAATPALVMKSHWASPRSSHEPVGATLTVETHMA